MFLVSQSKVIDKKSGKARPLRYSDIPMDKTQWVMASDYRPIPFDLLYLRIKDFPKEKAGWWDGNKWKGLRVKKHDEIIAWKRQLYDYALA